MGASRETLLGIPVVAFVTDLIMRFTPASFNRKKFALIVSTAVALIASILEAQFASKIPMFEAITRGFVVAMGAAGAYDGVKNYAINPIRRKINGDGASEVLNE